MTKIFDLYKGRGGNTIVHYLESDVKEALNSISSIWNEISSMGNLEDKQFSQFLYNLKLHTVDDLLTVSA